MVEQAQGLADRLLSGLFLSKVIEDFSPLGNEPMEYYQWKTARMKAEGIHGINQRIIPTLPFGKKGVFRSPGSGHGEGEPSGESLAAE
jgi:hypothetical protein